MKVEILKFKDINSGLTQSGLQFTLDSQGKYSSRSSVTPEDFTSLLGLLEKSKLM